MVAPRIDSKSAEFSIQCGPSTFKFVEWALTMGDNSDNID